MQKSRNDSEIHKNVLTLSKTDSPQYSFRWSGMMLRAVIGYSSEIEKDDISGKTQQQKMNRVEPVEEVFHFQIAFFSVVEKDGHEGQGSCELILHDEGSGQTLDRTGHSGQETEYR